MTVTASIRRWRWIHTWTSILCTTFLLMLCITGLPLVFSEEINDALYDRVAAPRLATEFPSLGLDKIVAAGVQAHPHGVVTVLFWDSDDPGLVKLGILPSPDAAPDTARILTLDARTAKVLDERPGRRGVMAVLLTLHKELLMGLPGMLFLGGMGLLFIVATISGVVIYAPYYRGLDFGTVRDRSRRLRWLDLHNLIGIATILWVLVVGATGVINTVADPLFDFWRAREMPRLLAPYQGKPPLGTLGSVEAAARTAQEALPGKQLVSIVFPSQRFGSPRHYLIWTKGNTPLTSRLFTPALVDAETGALTRAEDLPWYLRTLEIARPLHFGDYGGLPLKLIWAAFDVATIIVLGSGLYLWVARRS